MRRFPSSRNVLASSGLVALATAWACQTPTSMTVEVTTDVPCGDAQARVANVVVGDPRSILNQVDAATSKDCTSEGPVGKVVLLPGEDENAEVAFKVIMGVDRITEDCGVVAPENDPDNVWAGCIVARRRLRFIEGEALVLEVPLRLDCVGTGCDETSFTTCVAAGHCVPADVDPEDCLERTCGVDDLPGGVTTAASATSSSSGGGEGGNGGDGPISSSSSGAGGSTGGSGGDGGQSAGGGGAGGGDLCLGPDECEDPGECATATCIDGRCGASLESEGSACDLGAEVGLCQADGDCVECLTAAHCDPPSSECRVVACSAAGACVESNAGSGVPCDGGTCLNGVCDVLDQCTNAVIDSGESDVDCGGVCPNCDEGRACDFDDDCQSDVCDFGVCVECTLDTDCNGTDYCEDVGAEAGHCRPTVDDGGPCDRGDECTSGFCSDGVCCNRACDATCEACGGGVCNAFAQGSDPGDECVFDECRPGTCDGASACDVAPAGSPCGAGQTCINGIQSPPDACTAAGICDPGAPLSCPSGVCDGNVCDATSSSSGGGGTTGSTTGTTTGSTTTGSGDGGGPVSGSGGGSSNSGSGGSGCVETGGGQDGCAPGLDCIAGSCCEPTGSMVNCEAPLP